MLKSLIPTFYERNIRVRTELQLSFEQLPSQSSYIKISQPTYTCSKLTIETLEQGVKYVQS